MATSRLLLSHLRRFTRSPSHAPLLYHLLHATLPPPEPSESPYFKHSPVSSRFFHSGSVDDDSLTDSGAYSVPIPVEIVNFCDGVMGSGKESILPVQTLISVLDAYYNLCGFPWWVIIATSTLAFRLALLPVVVLQLCKLRNIAELSPKLPPPFPPAQSGKSFIDQISLFRRETKTIGCPSFLWFLASVSIQEHRMYDALSMEIFPIVID